MMVLYATVLIVLLCFSGVLLFGAPYLPTLQPQVQAALTLARLKPGQTLLELGCGDGKVLIAAAQQGVHSVGYELNPLLYVLCRLRTWRYRQYIRIIWGDFWKSPWPAANVIFVFLLPKYMDKLDKKIMQYNHKPVKLVSFAFEIEAKQPAAKQDGLFLYHYA
jgi:hypothetical protein